MNKINIRKITSILILLLTATGIVTSLGQGCSQIAGQQELSSKEFDSGTDQPAPQSYMEVEKNGLVTGEQVIASLNSLSGISFEQVAFDVGVYTGTNGSVVLDAFNSRKDLYAFDYSSQNLTSPMMLVHLTNAGNFCYSMALKESKITDKTQRRFFKDVDFTKGASNLTAAQYSKVMTHVYGLIIGKNITDEQSGIMSQYYTEFLKQFTTAELSTTKSTFDLIHSSCALAMGSAETLFL